MSPPRRIPRPGALAWSPAGDALAFASQADTRSGLGLSVATSAAYPLDEVTLIAPDLTGNRSVQSLVWAPDGSRIFAIVEGREFGGGRGEVLVIPVDGSSPELVWSSGFAPDAQGASALAVSPDGSAVAIVATFEDESSLVVIQQIGGTGNAAIPLPGDLRPDVIAWTDAGVAVAGSFGPDENKSPIVVLVGHGGELVVVEPRATPVASPAASPDFESPVPVASPRASPQGTPHASPVASPVASPFASPVTGTVDSATMIPDD
jgi:dipeptidyl aminopeptidase/acylaminoacyl peptidase